MQLANLTGPIMEELIKATAALIFVLSLILGMGWLGRRYANSRANVSNSRSDLRIVEWRGMDSRRKLAVVHWDNKEHLLCLSQTDQCLIASRDAPSPQETPLPQQTSTASPTEPPPTLRKQILSALPKLNINIGNKQDKS